MFRLWYMCVLGFSLMTAIFAENKNTLISNSEPNDGGNDLNAEIENIKIDDKHRVQRSSKEPVDCQEIQDKVQQNGQYMVQNGVYSIYHKINEEVKNISVYCDMETDGGGWTVIQKRHAGKERFDRYWNEYKYGFGLRKGDYWLGNDNIHALTRHESRMYDIRFDVTDSNDNVRYAVYRLFKIDHELNKYRLTIGKKIGGNIINDCMSKHNQQDFSTEDCDNDKESKGSCSKLLGSAGWWFNACGCNNLNGIYSPRKHSLSEHIYSTWIGLAGDITYNLVKTKMMIRPLR